MTKTRYQSYLQSDHWQDLRSQALRRDGYRCVKCGYTKTLQVHHLRYRYSPYASLLEDLMTLCDECHGLVHGITTESAAEQVRLKRSASQVSSSVYDDFRLSFPVVRSGGFTDWLRRMASRMIVFIRHGEGDTLGVHLRRR